MNHAKFIEILKEKGIQYSISSAGKIIIEGDSVYIPSLTSLPKRVEFNNGGSCKPIFINLLTKRD